MFVVLFLVFGCSQGINVHPGLLLGSDTITSLAGNLLWNDPTVLFDEASQLYNMWATHAPAGNFFNVSIWRLTSVKAEGPFVSDSTPALVGGDMYDQQQVETPSVVYFKGLYHMFTTNEPDKDNPTTWSVGHATSPSIMGPWSKTMPAVFPFSPYVVVAEPGAVVFNNTLLLFFTGVVSGVDVRIVATTSTDGFNFTTPVETLPLNSPLFPQADGWIGYSTATAVVILGQVHLYCGVIKNAPLYTAVQCTDQGGFYQVAIHHMWSNSSIGYGNWQFDSAPLLTALDLSWCELRSGYALIRPPPHSNVLDFWFAGQRTGVTFPNSSYPWSFGIGYANDSVPCGPGLELNSTGCVPTSSTAGTRIPTSSPSRAPSQISKANSHSSYRIFLVFLLFSELLLSIQ